MDNIDLKNLYWESDSDKRKEIKNTLYKRSGKQHRIRKGFTDLIIYVVDHLHEEDEEVAVMVNGVFTMQELEGKNIIL